MVHYYNQRGKLGPDLLVGGFTRKPSACRVEIIYYAASPFVLKDNGGGGERKAVREVWNQG